MTAPAKFLVFADETRRAILFDSERRLLGEVIEDDGFIVDRMLRNATACPEPADAFLQAIVPPPSPQWPVDCFELH